MLLAAALSRSRRAVAALPATLIGRQPASALVASPLTLFGGAFNLQSRLMKVRSSLKKRCDECYFAKRGKILYMYCKADSQAAAGLHVHVQKLDTGQQNNLTGTPKEAASAQRLRRTCTRASRSDYPPSPVVLTRAGNVTDIETKSQRTRKTQDSTHHSNAVSTRSHRTRRQVPPATQGTAESSAPLITMDGIAAAHNRHAASQLLSPTGRRILVVAAAQLRASHSRRRRD